MNVGNVCVVQNKGDVEADGEDDKMEYSFCGVFDGHGGDYVSEYVNENLLKRFHEQLMLKCNDESTSISSDSEAVLDTFRISFKEAVCRVDREILQMDSEKIKRSKKCRREAFNDENLATSALDMESVSGGSCAAVAIVYHVKGVNSMITPLTGSTISSLSASSLHNHTRHTRIPSHQSLLRRSFHAREKHASTEDYSTIISDYDIESDKALAGNGVSRGITRRIPSTWSSLSDLSFGNAPHISRSNSLLSSLSDEIYLSGLKMNVDHVQILAAIKSNKFDLSKFEVDDVREVADELKRKSANLQKIADECRVHSDKLLEMINEGSADCVKMNSIVENRRGGENESVSSMLSTIHMKTSIQLSPSSSIGSMTSLRSFGDGDSEGDLGISNKKTNKTQFSHLSTVSEGNGESRTTSFDTTAMASQNSFRGMLQGVQVSQGSNNIGHTQSDRSTSLSPEFKQCILIAHIGDCRAVLCDNGVAIPLTDDHTPSREDEVVRIKLSGSFISKKRVNGVLAVSRSFGDTMYKSYDETSPAPTSWIDEESYGIWSKANAVISTPDFLELFVQPTYEFIILATDGLWNIFSSTDAVDFVRSQLLAHGDAMLATNALVEQASKDGAVDNASVVVLCLNQT